MGRLVVLRGVAQLGRALGSGPRGRWFESSRPDHFRENGPPASRRAGHFFSFLQRPAESVGHAERKLQLPRLIKHIGRTRRLQIGARRDDAVVVRQVLRVEDVERLDDALQAQAAGQGEGLRQAQIELVVVLLGAFAVAGDLRHRPH